VGCGEGNRREKRSPCTGRSTELAAASISFRTTPVLTARRTPLALLASQEPFLPLPGEVVTTHTIAVTVSPRVILSLRKAIPVPNPTYQDEATTRHLRVRGTP